MSNKNNNNAGNRGNDGKPADSAPGQVTEASPPQISDDSTPGTTGGPTPGNPPTQASEGARSEGAPSVAAWSYWAVKSLAGAVIAFLRLAPDMPAKTFANQIYSGHLRHKLTKEGRNPPPVKGVEIEILETEQCPTVTEGQLTQFECKAKVELRDGCATIHQLCGLILEEKVVLVEA